MGKHFEKGKVLTYQHVDVKKVNGQGKENKKKKRVKKEKGGLTEKKKQEQVTSRIERQHYNKLEAQT